MPRPVDDGDAEARALAEAHRTLRREWSALLDEPSAGPMEWGLLDHRLARVLALLFSRPLL